MVRGDVDNDGKIDIADVTALINTLLSNDTTLVNVANADCYQDGQLTIDDLTLLINYLLSKSWAR